MEEALEESERATARIVETVRQLQTFARGDEPARTAVDVEAVVRATLRMLANQTDVRTRVITRLSGVRPVTAREVLPVVPSDVEPRITS